METVQLQCGHCGQLMAVSVEHMGIQVHCPHCEQVVQVPAAQKPAPPLPRRDDDTLPKLHIPASREEDSVLDDRNHGGDDLFGAHAAPRLKVRPSDAAAEKSNPFGDAEPASASDLAGSGDADLPPPAIHRPREQPSMFVPIVFMFLVPYAIATTGYIGWLLYSHSKNRFDPLERLPDPKPGEGGPRQIQHDIEVKLRTPLQQPIQVGDLEVTPLKVERNAEDDLTLYLRMRNISRNVEFNPIHDEFGKYRESLAVGKPYTFLEPLTHKPEERMYGGYLRWMVQSRGREREIEHTDRFAPGQEMIITLTTYDRDRKRVRHFAAQPQNALWRVQVRRGFLNTHDGPRSATAVIGVEFNSSAIEKAAT